MANEKVNDRIGWEAYLKPFFFKELSSRTGWSATLGTLCLPLFGLLAATGVFLAIYNPSPDEASIVLCTGPTSPVLRSAHVSAAKSLQGIYMSSMNAGRTTCSVETKKRLVRLCSI